MFEELMNKDEVHPEQVFEKNLSWQSTTYEM